MKGSATAEQALKKAKIGIMRRLPFLAFIGMQIDHHFDNVPTACTNGLFIKYNESWFMSLTHEMRMFLIAHEIWHTAFMHPFRKGNKDHVLWNKACDYVINFLLVEAGFEMPVIGLYDSAFRGMSSEEVYNILVDRNEPTDDYEDFIDILSGGQAAPGDPPGVEDPSVKHKVHQAVSRAVTMAKMSGGVASNGIPNEIERMLNELINPVLPWNRIVNRELQVTARNRFTYTRANRRYAPGAYLPSKRGRSIGRMVIALDLSGSITDEMRDEMISECEHFRKRYKPSHLTILDFDYKIHNIHTPSKSQDLRDLRFSGGNWTSYKPMEKYCDTHKTDVLLCFTDLEIEEEDDIVEKKPYNIIWINHGDHKLQHKIGRTVQYYPHSR